MRTHSSTHLPESASLAERLLDLADELRGRALELLEAQTGAAFDARVSELLDRVADEESCR